MKKLYLKPECKALGLLRVLTKLSNQLPPPLP
jgi:hypothetical protein